MSRYPTPPQSQTDSNSIALSAYQQQRSNEVTNKINQIKNKNNNLHDEISHKANQPLNVQQQLKTNNHPTLQSSTSQDPPPITLTVRTHYDLLHNWLHKPSQNFIKSPQNRVNPRDKLTRLTRQQFQELSTDVYDELVRRISRGVSEENPSSSQRLQSGDSFLASRDDFHPKRNQARQKLSTLPHLRFKDLVSDVYYELERRYPELTTSEPLVPLNQNTNTPLSNKLPSNPSRQPITLPTNPSRSHNPPPHASAGMVTTDLVVPDKSTLIIENNDDAYDNQISTVSQPIEPPSRSVSIEQTEPRDRRKGPIDRRRSGSLSSIKYISHKQNGSDPYAATSHPSIRDRKDSNASKFSLNEHDRRMSIMQSKIILLEKELSESRSNNSRFKSHAAQLEEREEELAQWKQLCEDQKVQLKDLHQTLEDEKKSKLDQLSTAEQEIKQLKREISDLNRRVESNHSISMARSNTNANDPMIVKLKAEVTELVDELRRMQIHQDRLLADQENFQEIILDLERAASQHRKRYEAAKTELRTLKRSSTQYSPKEFLPNEKLPLSENGGITDMHFTMFTTSIDDLLRAGRSNVTNESISVIKAVIDSVGDIDEDVQQLEAHPSLSSRLSLEEQAKLDVLKGRINATLTNLITAWKNHVASLGLSPISLLDAAASHLCFSIVELLQLVGMRRAKPAEIDLYESFHSKRLKYDDDEDDSNENARLDNTGFKLRAAIGEISNPKVGRDSPRLWSDESPAPLKVGKDRDNGFNRVNNLNGQNAVRNGTSNVNPNTHNNFLERSRILAGSGANSVVTRQTRPLNSNEKYLEQPAISRTQQIASKFEDLRSPNGHEYGSNASDVRDSASGSSSTNPDKVFDSPPRGGTTAKSFPRSLYHHGELSDSSSRPTQISNFQAGTSKPNHEDLEKLKVYLDSQTELIVGSIQSLLSTIRGTAINDSITTTEMRTNLDQIIQVVSDIMAKCSSDHHHNDPKFEFLLDELNQNCKKLSQLNDLGFHQNKTGSDGNGQIGFSKQVKQSMAAVSFGVAKALKELNTHVCGTEESLL